MSIPSIHQQRGFSIEQWLKTIFQWELTPLRISLLYLVLGTGSLFFSDVLLVQWVESAALLAQLQAAKGGLEVLLTAGFIYVLTKRSRRSLQQKNASLRKLKEERTVLHRVFRHNLRNSMNIVQGSATNLARDLPNPDTNQDIDRILRQSDRVVRLCEHASTIDETTMVDDENHVAIDLPELVDTTVTEIRAQYPDADITTDVPADVTVRGHPQLETALEEAISNAHQHAGGNSPQVEVTAERTRGNVVLHVVDDGPGIPDIEYEALEPGPKTSLTHGSGLGMWMMNWVLRQSGGALRFQSSGSGGHVVFVLQGAEG
ncbi:HAMP domain-containing histidine kinase [Haloferax larsenii]|uniref:histidine kinase n=1 Tax=Haloferax larsenii TaxID=302484 RepID=A0ABY5REK3_HALLR|nr:HAMP domain-containing sensor histidine kinase [Haloferax larsenii]UVE50589.1 HAMP domain-containing histidine kinase [Haloferax larsenii]